MSRRDRMIDPFGGDDDNQAEERSALTMTEAADALFGALGKQDRGRQTVQPVSIFHVFPDVQQPRRAVPYEVRVNWSGRPENIANLFNSWLVMVNDERKSLGLPGFDLDGHLWAEAIEKQQRAEDDLNDSVPNVGPLERSFLKVIELAVSIRRDGLANPVTVQRLSSDDFKLETGERRWLAYHILFGYFDGNNGKPEERSHWEKIPAIVVDDFNVWRQASENASRADLNAIGRARQFGILMMDLLRGQGKSFKPFEVMVQAGQSDRIFYAQVASERVPSGKSELLLNGLGMSHRAAFSRCRTLLNLPDEVWMIGDSHDLAEDELLRLAKLDPRQAIQEARKIAENVASRNKLSSDKSTTKRKPSPTLFTDPACKHGKRLFNKQNQLVARELLSLHDGVGQARPATKQQIRQQIDLMRNWLDALESAIDKSE